MNDIPNCPVCESEYAYHDGKMFVCPDCNHEWTGEEVQETDAVSEDVVKDAFGNVLVDGDNVTIIKDLPVRGASKPLKMGTKVKGIRICGGDHNIDCKIPDFGAMKLKSEFVKKS
ncbi:MAG: zinc ribbon domain-containing protein YjdM [Lentisphaeria bacterium]